MNGGFRGGFGSGGGYGGGRRYDNRGPPAPRGGGWGGGASEADPFAEDAARKHEVDSLFKSENTGINFDAYEDIPVRDSYMTGLCDVELLWCKHAAYSSPQLLHGSNSYSSAFCNNIVVQSVVGRASA